MRSVRSTAAVVVVVGRLALAACLGLVVAVEMVSMDIVDFDLFAGRE